MVEKYIFRAEDERVLIDVPKDIFVRGMKEKGIAVEVKGKVATFRCVFCHSPGCEYSYPTKSHAFGRYFCRQCGEKSSKEISSFLGLSVEQLAARPLLVLNQMAPSVQEAIEIILSRSKRVFLRNGVIVVVLDSKEAGTVTLKTATVSELISLVHEQVRSIQYDGRLKRTVQKNIPEKVVRGLFDRLEHKHLLPIRRIVHHPLIDGSGRVIPKSPRYDKKTNFYFAFRSEDWRDLEGRVTTEEAVSAYKQLLTDALGGFTFKDKTDEAAAVLLLVTAIVVPILKATPLFLISSEEFGAGKTTLCQVAAIFASTTLPTVITSRRDTDEFTRELMASLSNSAEVLIIENLIGNIPLNPTLCSVLSGTEVSGRVVGSSRTISMSLSGVLVMATGAKIVPQEDMVRRIIPIWLEKTTRPYKQRNFLESIRAKRSQLVFAVLKIVMWGRQNEVSSKQPILSFEPWDDWCRQPICALTHVDPCSRLKDSIDALDFRRQRRPSHEVVLDVLQRIFHEEFFSTKQVQEIFDQFSSEAKAAVRELGLNTGERLNLRRFGRWLANLEGALTGENGDLQLKINRGKGAVRFRFQKIGS